MKCNWETIIFIAVIVELFSIASCKKGPVEPPPPKDPRLYTWTVDTLAYPGSFQTAMQDIWASSSTNVYIVGHNDQPGPGTMFRFDGTEWRTTGFHAGEGGPITGPVSLSAIYGFSANNIFAVGERIYQNPNPPPNFFDSSLIIHFDGTQWSEHTVTRGRFLQTIWGSGPDDVWTAGWKGTLFHFDGTQWTKIPMDTSDRYYDLAGFGRNDVYLLGGRTYSPGQPEYHVLLRYDGMNWSVMDSGSVSFFRVATLGSTLYRLGYGLHAWRNGSWQEELVASAPLQGLYSLSTTNVFVVGQQSLVYHSNGQTWQQLNIIEGPWWLHAVWSAERETFIVGTDAGGFKTIVLHGK